MNLKQVPQNFMKVSIVNDVQLKSWKINIVSEKIINYRVTSRSIVKLASWFEKNLEFWYNTLCSLSKTRTCSLLYLFTLKFVYKDVTVRYLNYLNRCVVIRLS